MKNQLQIKQKGTDQLVRFFYYTAVFNLYNNGPSVEHNIGNVITNRKFHRPHKMEGTHPVDRAYQMLPRPQFGEDPRQLPVLVLLKQIYDDVLRRKGLKGLKCLKGLKVFTRR